MKEQIIVKVERPSMDASKPYIKVFEKIVDSDSQIKVPYQTIVDSFRFLFGFLQHRLLDR